MRRGGVLGGNSGAVAARLRADEARAAGGGAHEQGPAVRASRRRSRTRAVAVRSVACRQTPRDACRPGSCRGAAAHARQRVTSHLPEQHARRATHEQVEHVAQLRRRPGGASVHIRRPRAAVAGTRPRRSCRAARTLPAAHARTQPTRAASRRAPPSTRALPPHSAHLIRHLVGKGPADDHVPRGPELLVHLVLDHLRSGGRIGIGIRRNKGCGEASLNH